MSPGGPGRVEQRFAALDALRGICALCVALFHFAAVSNADPGPFVANSWLFVDFFFVLSGFVIASAYGAKLSSGFSASDFLILRLGRIYPLHLAMIAAFFLLELVASVVARHGFLERAVFAGATAPDALAGSLGLVQIFGLWPRLVWNGPSWSIAAEMWAYLVFAMACQLARPRHVTVMLLIATACAVWLVLDGDPWLNRTYSASLVRCLFGFGLGVFAFGLRARVPAGGLAQGHGDVAEILALSGVIGFVCLAVGAWTLLAPPVFMLALLVFSREAGAVSRCLGWWPLRWLGVASYSIYMVHVFVLGRISDAYQLAQSRLDLRLIEPCALDAGKQCFAGSGEVLAMTAALFLPALLLASWLCWRFIEEPGRRWSRRQVRDGAARRAARGIDEHGAF